MRKDKGTANTSWGVLEGSLAYLVNSFQTLKMRYSGKLLYLADFGRKREWNFISGGVLSPSSIHHSGHAFEIGGSPSWSVA